MPGAPPYNQQDVSSKKVMAGIMGIFLGGLGIHKFVLGFTGTGVLMLCLSLLTCGFGAMVMGPIGLIEGIIYLTKTDEEFYRFYIVEKKQWF
ncbi:MAG: TM2 domain-containing protein [Tepidisphaerales bacterium]